MITTKDIVNSLKVQKLCPRCHVDWTVLEDSLYDIYSRDEALIIVENCRVCQMRFEGVK